MKDLSSSSSSSSEGKGDKRKKNKKQKKKEFKSQGITLSTSNHEKKGKKDLIKIGKRIVGARGNGIDVLDRSDNNNFDTSGLMIKHRTGENSNNDNNKKSTKQSKKYCNTLLCCHVPHVHHHFSLWYFHDIPGCIFFNMYLWLLRDLGWSQLNYSEGWVYVGLAAGTASVCWSLGVLLGAARLHLYDMLWISFAIFLWSLSNYVWMINDFYSIWSAQALLFNENSEMDFNNTGRALSKYILTIAIFMMFVFYAVLLPNQVFGDAVQGRRPSPLQRRLGARAVHMYFIGSTEMCFGGNSNYRSDQLLVNHFGIYVTLLIFKDCMNAWEFPKPYIVAYMVILLLILDLFCRQILIGHKHNQYANVIHTIISLLWVTGTTVWELTELRRHGAIINKHIPTILEIRQYTFISTGENALFYNRACAGWIYLVAVCTIILFYLQWIFATPSSVPGYEEYLAQFHTVNQRKKPTKNNTATLLSSPLGNAPSIIYEEEDDELSISTASYFQSKPETALLLHDDIPSDLL